MSGTVVLQCRTKARARHPQKNAICALQIDGIGACGQRPSLDGLVK
jgi:hypothetical protein